MDIYKNKVLTLASVTDHVIIAPIIVTRRTVFSEMKKRTLLIDTNFFLPKLHTLLQIVSTNTINDLLISPHVHHEDFPIKV
ncbi:hypothetical protein [Bacillus thuringiensis]|uniref:hypothetical protein n=1 Tax=Bacillus thuringiensis TaxID=1428 RepID=UPI0015E16438|nr:hypothetical protein [Bacillus thuringiensis]